MVVTLLLEQSKDIAIQEMKTEHRIEKVKENQDRKVTYLRTVLTRQ